MDEKALKYMGILVAIIMIGSMFAIVLYGSESSVPEASNEELTGGEEFSYEVSFQGTVTRDLGAIRFATKTNIIDKEIVDKAVLGVEGVSRINSTFRKSTDDVNWYYFAEVYLKKNADPLTVVDLISEIDYFSKTPGESQYVKYMTLSSPGKVQLLNKDLNITRDFNFDNTNLFVLAGINTAQNDEVSVFGTIRIIGNNVTFIELLEQENLTATPKQYSLSETLPIKELKETVLFEGERDQNSILDKEAIYEQVKNIDENAEINIFSLDMDLSLRIKSNSPLSEETIDALKEIEGIDNVTQQGDLLILDINLDDIEHISNKVKEIILKETFSFELVYPKETASGTTTISNAESIGKVLSSKGFSVKFLQEAEFFKENFFIPELNNTIDFNSTFPARINPGHIEGNEVDLDLTISIQRNEIVSVYAFETGINPQ